MSPVRLVGGRYRVDTVVGTGAMGTVWRGYDTRLRRPVAIKEVHLPSTATDDQRAGLTKRAMSEARHAARVAHPNIVAVHDVVADHGLPCLVMRLVEGRSLAEVVRGDGPVSPARAAQIGIALVDALVAAHSGGVVHRDVKPSNVLVTDGGEVLLTDFSIATDSFRGTMSAGSGALGSPGYIAPERLNGDPTGPPADLFGLGATLFCAVEGTGPFDRADPLAALMATATAPHPAPKRAGPLAPLLDSLLAKDPTDRPDLTRVRAALDAVARAPRPVAATTLGKPTATAVLDATPRAIPRTVTSHAAPRSRRRIAALVGGGVIALCLALVTVAVVVHDEPGRDDGAAANTASIGPPASTPAPPTSASPTAVTPSAAATRQSPARSAAAPSSVRASPNPSPPPGQTSSATLAVSPPSYLGSCADDVALTVNLSVTVSTVPTSVRYRLSLAPGDTEIAAGAGTVAAEDQEFTSTDQVGVRFSQGSGTYAVQAVIETPSQYAPVPATVGVVCLG